MAIETWNWMGLYFLAGVIAFVLMTLAVSVIEGHWVPYFNDHPFVKFIGKTKAAIVAVAEHVTVMLIWPLVVPVIAYELFTWIKSMREEKYHSQFHFRPKHLYRKMTVSEAEAEATVLDPLGRVPALPFGHLNAGWIAFVAKMEPDVELWRAFDPGAESDHLSESAPKWAEPRGWREGYALLRKKRIQAEFIFEWD